MPENRKAWSSTADFDPTPEEIAATCAEIRADWSPTEWRIRGGGTVHPMGIKEISGRVISQPCHLVTWTVPVCRVHGNGGGR